jgi:hypothetical protein
MVWATVGNRELPAEVDREWREQWAARARQPLPEHYLDSPVSSPHQEDAAMENARVLRELLRIHRL